MDTADVNLRVAIIPEAERSRFVHARLDYRKTVAPGEKCGTNGFLAKITDKLPATMNLWKMSTNTQDSGGGGETGGKRFLIECPNEDDAESMVKDVFKSIAAQKENGWEVFADAQVISYRGVETMLDEQSRADVDYEFQYDVFLSYSHRDNEEASDIEDEFKAAGIRYFRAPKEVQPGDDFVETIRTGLTASRELCLLYTPNAAESEWVSTEWGAAWALQKKITAVLIGIPPDELPQRLSSIQCVQRHKLDEYIEAIIERRGSFHMS